MPYIISLDPNELTLKKLRYAAFTLARYSLDVSQESIDEMDDENQLVLFDLNKYTGRNAFEALVSENENEILPLETRTKITIDWLNTDTRIRVAQKELDHRVQLDSADELESEFRLEESLRLFTEEEVLRGKEEWFCPRCKVHREATKKLTIWRLPQILVIQLKRFSFRNILFRDKLNDFVDFPLEGA